MQIDQAVFLRIDTVNSSPYLTNAAGESIIDSLLEASSKRWFDLLGFVVLPAEVQLLIVPRGRPVNDILSTLESAARARLSDVELIFDPDYYREKVDCEEEIRQRLRWMHNSPVRARLTPMSSAFPYSSA